MAHQYANDAQAHAHSPAVEVVCLVAKMVGDLTHLDFHTIRSNSPVLLHFGFSGVYDDRSKIWNSLTTSVHSVSSSTSLSCKLKTLLF